MTDGSQFVHFCISMPLILKYNKTKEIFRPAVLELDQSEFSQEKEAGSQPELRSSGAAMESMTQFGRIDQNWKIFLQ